HEEVFGEARICSGGGCDAGALRFRATRCELAARRCNDYRIALAGGQRAARHPAPRERGTLGDGARHGSDPVASGSFEWVQDRADDHAHRAEPTWSLDARRCCAGASRARVAVGHDLGSGLGGQSRLLTRGERRGGWAWLAYEERRFDGFRAYYELVPKGHWTVEYTVRFDNPGNFQMPATRVEAMYAPEMFGELPNAQMKVEPGAAVR